MTVAKILKISLLIGLTALLPHTVCATQITIINLDGANEGFNDTTPATTVGCNTATTNGAQRVKAFEYAAQT